MSHLDEGKLAALFDHELDPEEQRAAEAHLAGCAECQVLWEEIQLMAGEAFRLVASVDLPPRAALAPSSLAMPAGDSEGARHTPPWRTLAWAATIVLALGLGYSMRGLSRPDGPQTTNDFLATSADKAAPAAAAVPAPAAAPSEPASAGARREAPAERKVRQATPAPSPSVPPGPASRRDAGEAAVQALQQPTTSGGIATAQPQTPRDAAAPEASGQGIVQSAQSTMKSAAPIRSARETRLDSGAASPAGGGLRQISMEVAVKTLEGSIRLVDGLNPERILFGPAALMAGGDSALDVVRVVYQDPPGRELWLDQQRLPASLEARRNRAPGRLLPGDTLLTPTPGGPQSVQWLDQHGFLLVLTGFLPGDSLRALIPMVR